MIDRWSVIGLSFAYVSILFGLAWYGDRAIRWRKGGGGRPLIYALSIAVYCTSWTFFGSVGLAASTGYDFIPVYLGAIVFFTLGSEMLLRIVRVAKGQNITSVADFLAARYGKSQAVAAIVTIVAVIGTLPYIALQLKAVALSVDTLLGAQTSTLWFGVSFDTAFFVAIVMATFTVLFGTRHIDATEHQEGLVLAIAAKSIVKLAAFLAVGLFISISIFGSVAGFADRIEHDPAIHQLFARGFNGATWITVTLLSFIAVILLPRQFHVAVVENNSEKEIRRAKWLFPLYLVLINVFVVPIAAAGLATLPKGTYSNDTFVLALPLTLGSEAMTLLAFVGGLSAATAMVIVDSVALAIMISNGLVVPLMLRRRLDDPKANGDRGDMAGRLLAIRRVSIFVIILLGYGVYRVLGLVHGLASIGLVSFAAIAQLAPAFFGGLIWRKGTARGAIAGLVAGFLLWAYTLVLPWCVEAGLLARDIVTDGPLGLAILRPQALFYLQLEPLSHGVFWSLGINTIAFVVVSLLRAPEPIERLQAQIFVQDDAPRLSSTPSFRLWRTSVTIGDLQHTIARYLGTERVERSFAEYAASRNARHDPTAEADISWLRFSEHLLASAIGAASSRLVLSLLLRRGNMSGQSALRLLDDASEALQYNRDLLQSALDQVRHGLSVFDKDLNLICWNRQYRELLDLPADFGRVGVPLEQILRTLAERGDFGRGNIDAAIADRMIKLSVTKETFQETMARGKRILEVRTAAMPQGGIVTTYSDITERVAAAEALARANETLERRVRERTQELQSVNDALGVAKAKADAANLDKTRFLAAASHDVLQPLNAARLYASSLIERPLHTFDRQIANNVDASLAAVEDILGALIDIARLDSGRMEPEITHFPLSDVMGSIAIEFGPMALERGLDLRIVPSSLWVRSDRRMLRRVLHNLVSNAIKYTARGCVVVGVRRRSGEAMLQVCDTGPGIPASKQALIFREFERLEETAAGVRGLGLGLSIVERISKVLGLRIELASMEGRGSRFAVCVPSVAAQARVHEIAPIAAASRLSGLSVLCIDNEPAVLDGMKTLLTGWGCRVVTASGTDLAIDALRSAGEVPDIILADYHLDATTGLDAIAGVLKALTVRRPAIVITADYSQEMQRDVRRHGYGLLRKPLKAAALRALMTQLTLQGVAAE